MGAVLELLFVDSKMPVCNLYWPQGNELDESPIVNNLQKFEGLKQKALLAQLGHPDVFPKASSRGEPVYREARDLAWSAGVVRARFLRLSVQERLLGFGGENAVLGMTP